MARGARSPSPPGPAGPALTCAADFHSWSWGAAARGCGDRRGAALGGGSSAALPAGPLPEFPVPLPALPAPLPVPLAALPAPHAAAEAEVAWPPRSPGSRGRSRPAARAPRTPEIPPALPLPPRAPRPFRGKGKRRRKRAGREPAGLPRQQRGVWGERRERWREPEGPSGPGQRGGNPAGTGRCPGAGLACRDTAKAQRESERERPGGCSRPRCVVVFGYNALCLRRFLPAAAAACAAASRASSPLPKELS